VRDSSERWSEVGPQQFREAPLALVVVPVGEGDAGAIAAVLAEMGLRYRLYHDAGSALEAVEYDRPALVVHGWDLPDMDAVMFHGAVRTRAAGRSVPTLAIAPDPEAANRIPDDPTGRSVTLVRPLHRAVLAERLEEFAARAGIGGSLDWKDRWTPAGPERKVSRMERSAPGMRMNVIGLGEWGLQGAEIFDRQEIPARAIDVAATLERSSLSPDRCHAITASGDHATAAGELAADPALGEALRGDGEAELYVIVADLGVGVGSLAATVLQRLSQIAPRAGRHLIARLPGVRSRPDERALGLVALNAVLEGPPAGIFLVTAPDGMAGADDDADPAAPLYRILDLWSLVGGAGPEAVQALRGPALGRFLATPGFVGWRETALSTDDIMPESRGWHELVAPVLWQHPGYVWEEAQEVMVLGRLPWAWLQGGGRRQFEQLVRRAWDEAAPCAVVPALYAGDPASVLVVSAGMPFPHGLLALRDSVAADRERLAEKRRKAATQIPLADDFLPPDFEVLPPTAPSRVSRYEPEPTLPAPPLVVAPEPATTWEPEPAAIREPEPAAIREPEAAAIREPEAEPETAATPEREPAWPSVAELEAALEPTAERAEPAPEPSATEPVFSLAREEIEAVELELPAIEPGVMPLAYESALALVRRILSAQDIRAEVDLGEVRYALYDLLEILREEPHALLPEVFRPELDEYFERHHVNVAILAILTGDLMRGSLSEVIDLGTAALLHDIGMLPTRGAWDAEIKLPPNVFDQAIRPHPELGYQRLLELTGITGTVARMVLEEHERIDGSGYPQGIGGVAIDPGARILAACDSLEAMTHPRPYRDHLSPGEALARLQILGQYTLDTAVVQALTEELQELLRRGAPESEQR
jgi:hypothetical protein